jgi:hypothetical protein
VRSWLLRGEETGRGPDNEPLVVCTAAVAWISLDAIRECERIVDQASGADEGGPLARFRREHGSARKPGVQQD